MEPAKSSARRPARRQVTPSKATSNNQPLPQNDVNNRGASSIERQLSSQAQVHGDMNTKANAANLNTSTQLDASVLQSWKNELVLPLCYARLETYHTSTDREREDGFEVLSNEKISSGLIICGNQSERNEWISAISEAIHKATLRASVGMKELSSSEIVHMGWVGERSVDDATYKNTFVVLASDSIYMFDSPPVSLSDWQGCQRSYRLYEILYRSHVPPRTPLDKRQHCFSIQHSTESPIYCSVQTADELARWEDQIQRSTFEAVYKLKVKSYACLYDGRSCSFIVHFNDGFKLVDETSQEEMWSYKFSQLKNSSDDGATMITFSFLNRETDQTDTQSITCDVAYSLLFCVHSFLAAKLSLVDPATLEKASARASADAMQEDSGGANGITESR